MLKVTSKCIALYYDDTDFIIQTRNFIACSSTNKRGECAFMQWQSCLHPQLFLALYIILNDEKIKRNTQGTRLQFWIADIIKQLLSVKVNRKEHSDSHSKASCCVSCCHPL